MLHWIPQHSPLMTILKMTTMMTTRREGADEAEDGAGGVLHASGVGAENSEGKDGKDDD